MKEYLAILYYPVEQFFTQSTKLSEQQWMIILWCVGLFGLFAMRGVGSRKNY